MPDTHTVPSPVEQLSTSTLSYLFDFTWACQLVSATETLTAVTVTATQVDTATAAPQVLVGTATISGGTSVKQAIGNLTPGKSFRVIVTATGASGNVWASRTDFICPF